MIGDLIPAFDAELRTLRAIGSSGFFLGFGINLRGAEHMQIEYPQKWQDEYEAGSYYIADPVVIWVFTQKGCSRWSEIKIPDVRGIMKKATVHGMIYGAVFSCTVAKKKCFLTVSRNDRELTDAELDLLNTRFEIWSNIVMGKSSLTDKELDVLRLLRDGFAQKQIADELMVAETTVKKRALSACSKLGAKSRTQAVAIAVSRNYFSE